jgi:sulfite reductase (NADPH) hemoprotein beta-component
LAADIAPTRKAATGEHVDKGWRSQEPVSFTVSPKDQTMPQELSRNERIKEASRHLRGKLAEGLAEEITGGIVESDQQIVKFHGMYLQDDRDLRGERRRKKMEPAFAFMVRVRIPGGVLTPSQYLALDEIGQLYAGNTMRITTRQTIQLHGIIKGNLKATMAHVDAALLTTIAACGDVNRNVICNSNPNQSRAHAAALATARALSDHLLPRTPAYREIWLDGERIAGGEGEIIEPIYGTTYLPRKFKIAVAVPPSNDVDVFAHDLGYIAILDENDALAGYNVTVGGGMGMTHGEPETYPRTADVMGYCRPQEAVAVGEAVVTVQRDWGDRTNRKHARLKYTIEDRGLDAFRTEVERRSGVKLGQPQPFRFTSTGDRYGWSEGANGRAHLTLFVENGRIRDLPHAAIGTGLRRIAETHDGDIRLTTNQNVIIANVAPDKRAAIEALVAEHGLAAHASALRRNAMACVALPTCGLALAESERYLPSLVTALEERLAANGLADDEIVIRMTGCPNGCARPHLAEIGLVGKGPGRYNLYLGAAFDGSRLSKLYAEDLDHAAIIAKLDPVFAAYAAERKPGERFGAFAIRGGFVAPTTNGADFHRNTGAQRAA